MNWARLREVLHGPRHLLAMLTLVLFLVVLIDFFDRIFVSRDESLRRFDTPAIAKVINPTSAETILERVTVSVPEPKVEIVVKAREMALQAVFSQRGKTEAFILLLADAGRPEERVKVAVDAEVDGWKVASINRTRVTLKRGDEQRELVIFRGKVE